MRIAIILEDKHNNDPESVIDRVSKEGNVSYLVKGENNPEYPYLSQVESYDYSVFGHKDVPGIIEELSRVKEEVSDLSDKAHINDIIQLVIRCKKTPNTVLVFAG
jgi:hypothetical protein